MSTVITKLAWQTLVAIEAGIDTNMALTKYIGVNDRIIRARVSRLRLCGLVDTVTTYNGNGLARHTVTNKPFTVVENKRGIIQKRAVMKSYADSGENVYSNLDSYLYPKKLVKHLHNART